MSTLTLNAPTAGGAVTVDRPRLNLARGEVGLWRAMLDEPSDETVAALERTLAPDERERARSFYFARDRRRFVTGRGVLRALLGDYLGIAPEEVVLRYGPNGKPQLAPRAPEHGEPLRAATLHFNVAHSEGLAVFAFTRTGEVGVDVEKVRDLPDWEQVAEAVFPHHELVRMRARARSEQREEFFRAWTRQEARLKALGVGLAGARSPEAESDFQVQLFAPAAGFTGAIAVAPTVQWATLSTWCDPETTPQRMGRPRVRFDRLFTHGPNFL